MSPHLMAIAPACQRAPFAAMYEIRRSWFPDGWWRRDRLETALPLPDIRDMETTTAARQKAWGEFRRMLLIIGIAGVVMVAGALWYLSLFGPLYLSMILATVGGVFVSTLLGCGLFAAAFFSDKSGHDREVSETTTRDAPKD
ncbi:hypothetical protein ACG3SL_15835 [Sphingomonas sp. CJ20]